jgi:hypothetical protein
VASVPLLPRPGGKHHSNHSASRRTKPALNAFVSTFNGPITSTGN